MGDVRAGKALAVQGAGQQRPYLRTKNVFDGRIDLEDVLQMPMTDSEFARYELRHGDVLLNEGQSLELVGRCAVYRGELPVPCAIQNQLVRFRAREGVSGSFAGHLFRHCQRTGVFEKVALQTTSVAHLGVSRFEGLLLAWPSRVGEQEAIADALSDADAFIESVAQLLAKKRQFKQGAMQELLTGKRRLPGFDGKWTVERLSNIAEIRSGGTPSTTQPKFWDGDIPWCTPTDITALAGYKYLTSTSRTISQRGLEASAADLIPANSIVMTSRATIGECGINRIPVATNQGFKNFVPTEELDVEFFYYLLLTQKQGFIRLCGGSTFLEIGKGQLAAYEVRLPALRVEQSAIAAILSDMDAEIAGLEEKLGKARQLKQGMMQELLTGRIRLIQPEANVVHLPAGKESALVPAKSHNWQINEAVVVSVLAKKFGTEKFPLGRKRCTKLSYLLHRHVEHSAEGYLKKAAGPYNPAVKYKGPEGIAQKNRYVRLHRSDQYTGFVAGENISQAEAYFAKWYGDEPLIWLEQFRFQSNDELELLATVDMAMVDLRNTKKAEQLANVRKVIREHPEWEAKLNRAIFSDEKINRAMKSCQQLFSSGG